MSGTVALVAAGAALLLACTPAPPPRAVPAAERGIAFSSITHAGRTLPFAVYVPRAYDPARAWPLILFLHGSGESGTDGAKQLTQGLPPAVLADVGRWPAIVLAPQKPSEDEEWEAYEPVLLALVAQARVRYRIDPARIYLTGLSQGGHGAWVLGARHPGLWAAVAPVCGYASARSPGPAAYAGTAAELAERLRATPVWAFHGEADDVVPAAETRAMIDALTARGSRPRATFYPGVGHGCWDRAYRESGLAEWLLARRNPAANEP